MVHSFLQALKQIAVVAQLSMGEPKAYRFADPEPIRRQANDAQRRDQLDDWLFDDGASQLSPFVKALSGELDRVAGSLGHLRELLSSIARYAPVIEVLPVNAGEAPIIASPHSFLFDCEPVPRLGLDQPELSGDAIFLFEDGDHATHISVFDCPLQDKRIAA